MSNMNMKEIVASLRGAGDIVDGTELRESIAGGWHPEFPAIDDEYGVRLVGNRRTRFAKELGVAPVVAIKTFGDGEEADVARVRVAIISNTGTAPMTKEGRKRAAAIMYQQGWTMARIGEALGVTQKTVSKDLGDIYTDGINNLRTEKRGRPKGAPKPRKERVAPKMEAARKIVRETMDEGKPVVSTRLNKQYGIARAVFDTAVAAEEAVRETRAEIAANPTVTRADLSLSAQERFDAAIRQYKKQLDGEYDDRVRAGIAQALDDSVLAQYNKEKAEHDAVIKARKGIMKRPVFTKIWACLHPDRLLPLKELASRKDEPDFEEQWTNAFDSMRQQYEEAFNLFSGLKLVLCNEAEFPTGTSQFPRTFAEVEALKAKIKAEKQAGKRRKTPAEGAPA